MLQVDGSICCICCEGVRARRIDCLWGPCSQDISLSFASSTIAFHVIGLLPSTIHSYRWRGWTDMDASSEQAEYSFPSLLFSLRSSRLTFHRRRKAAFKLLSSTSTVSCGRCASEASFDWSSCRHIRTRETYVFIESCSVHPGNTK